MDREKKKEYANRFYCCECEGRKAHGNDRRKLSYGQFGILCTLDEADSPVTAGELAEKMRVGNSRIANALAKLEELGLISRKAGEKDKRHTLVSITEAGHEVIERKKRRFEDVIGDFVEAIGEEGYEAYLEYTHQLNLILQKHFEEEEKEEKTGENV